MYVSDEKKGIDQPDGMMRVHPWREGESAVLELEPDDKLFEFSKDLWIKSMGITSSCCFGWRDVPGMVNCITMSDDEGSRVTLMYLMTSLIQIFLLVFRLSYTQPDLLTPNGAQCQVR